MNKEEIPEVLKTLLTPDGEGAVRKAIVLREFVDTINGNWAREEITKFIEENGSKIKV